MPKSISESARQNVIKIAAQYNFVVQLKFNGEDQYVKNLMFYSKQLNQTVYIRKDRAIGAGGIPKYFQVAVHPTFFNTSWVSVTEGIEEHINRQKKKNLHSSSNYKKFPVFPENDEPCGMCFRVGHIDALAKLFQRMATDNDGVTEFSVEQLRQNVIKIPEKSKLGIAAVGHAMPEEETLRTPPQRTDNVFDQIPTKGLIIKSPYIDKILAGTKTWEMRSSNTNQRGPIALIKQGSGQIVGIAYLVGVKGPLSQQDKLNAINKHQMSEERLNSGDTDKWNIAWILENVQSLVNPVNYQHPNGAIIWVNLEPQVQEILALAIA